MENNTTNTTFDATQEKVTTHGFGPSQCIPWFVVLITEFLATAIFNIITIIVFVKQRQLQRRSTYLIIHLAFVDFLVGAIPGPLSLAGRMPTFCHLWKDPFKRTCNLYNSKCVHIVVVFYLYFESCCYFA